MTTLRNLTTHLVAAATALSLSLVLIGTTVSTTAPHDAASVVAANSEFSA